MDTLARLAGEYLPRLTVLSARLEAVSAEGVAAGGLVRATLRGPGKLASLKIDPSLASDVKALEELIPLAHKNALAKLEKERNSMIKEDVPELLSIKQWLGRIKFP